MEPLGIALVGCGTVGTGVARLLLEHPERLAARAGRSLILRHIVVRDPHRPRDIPWPQDRYTSDLSVVLRDPQVQVAVEVVGGVGWARQAPHRRNPRWWVARSLGDRAGRVRGRLG